VEEVNWGRIVALLCFGYRMAVEVLRSQVEKFAEFMSRIIKFLLKFLITERISRWIADHGGWVGTIAVFICRFPSVPV
jgi:Bcl-2 antagonist/killer family protein